MFMSHDKLCTFLSPNCTLSNKIRSNFQVNQTKGIRLVIAKKYLFAFMFFDLVQNWKEICEKNLFFSISSLPFLRHSEGQKDIFTHMLHYHKTCNAKKRIAKTFRLWNCLHKIKLSLFFSIRYLTVIPLYLLNFLVYE